MAPSKKKGGTGVFREFRLTSIAVEHPTTVLVLTFIIIVSGVLSYLAIPRESNPEITIPNIIVTTVYAGVSPRDIELLVTRPIEDELNGIPDVKTITSSSIEGYSSINVELEAGVDMSKALQDVREKVDIAKPDLPTAAEDPQIFEINFSDFPIMQVNISGDYDLVRLRAVAEELQDRLEQVPSVLGVDLAGGLEREVQVDVDLAKLKFYDLAFDDVIDAIRNENVTIPGGSIDVGEVKYLVRVPGEFSTTGPIADIVVAAPGGRPIYVRDVATVDFGFKERDSYARLDGKPVVTLSVSKRSGENIIETASAVRATIDGMTPELPPGTVIKITADQSDDIRSMVSNLENSIISGLILVVGVLLFALGVRTASFVGTAIPLSMLMSFSIIQLAGFTMNIVVLFSLILALGMLVDNGIVIVENIYRYREHGYDRKMASKLGAGEVAWPIIASTATTLAAFAPMAFWPGVIGEFMKFLPLTLMITLSSSLFVALVINPVFCALWLDPEDAPHTALPRATKLVLAGSTVLVVLIGLSTQWLPTVLLSLTVALMVVSYRFVLHPMGHWLMTAGLPRTIHRYEGVLRWALQHRGVMMSGAAATLLFVVGIFFFTPLNAGIELFPEDIPPSTAFVQVEAPLGTRVEQTDQITRKVEHVVDEVLNGQDLESVVSTVGQSVSGGFGGGQGTHLATVTLTFIDFQDRLIDVVETLETIRQHLERAIAGADVSVDLIEQGPPTGLPVTIEIVGDDPDILKQLGDDVVTRLERSPVFGKLDGLESDMADGRPELVVDVDREKAALYGLNTRDIGFTVRNAINGTEASKYRDGKDEYDITVRLAPAFRDNLTALGDLNVVADGRQIPLSSVASWRVGEGFGGINRKDLEKMVTVSSDVRQGYNAVAVLGEVQNELRDFEQSMPPGYRMAYAGQQQDQEEAQSFLLGAFMATVFLMALILVTQFDSVTKPLIILSSVVLSTIGVLIGLMVFRMPFGIIMTGVGVISLAGVVVNNAIVLLDYVDTLRYRDGLGRLDALVRAGLTRFRPVVLTAVTTVLGLVPLAIGLNFDFYGLFSRLSPDPYWGGENAAWWGPMAIAVIAGLTFATFLTLVLVPVMYSLLDDLDDFIDRHFRPAARHQDLEPGELVESVTEELPVPGTDEHPLPDEKSLPEPVSV